MCGWVVWKSEKIRFVWWWEKIVSKIFFREIQDLCFCRLFFCFSFPPQRLFTYPKKKKKMSWLSTKSKKKSFVSSSYPASQKKWQKFMTLKWKKKKIITMTKWWWWYKTRLKRDWKISSIWWNVSGMCFDHDHIMAIDMIIKQTNTVKTNDTRLDKCKVNFWRRKNIFLPCLLFWLVCLKTWWRHLINFFLLRLVGVWIKLWSSSIESYIFRWLIEIFFPGNKKNLINFFKKTLKMAKSSLTQYACLVMWCDVTPLKNSFFFSQFRIIHPNENIIIIIHLANNDDEDWQSYLVADDLKNSPSSLSYYLKRPLLVKWTRTWISFLSHSLSLSVFYSVWLPLETHWI
mgnify:CR=1 FL=1